MAEDGTRDVVLVTGASGGIGAALAAEFAAAGHDLFLTARNGEALAKVAATLEARCGIKADYLALDLTGRNAGARLETAIAQTGARVEILVNNAGFGLAGRVSRLDREAQLAMIDLNIRAVVDLTARFLPAMVKQRRGGVLNVGSIAGFQPGPYMAGYYATKAFIDSFSAALAFECRSAGVTITNLAPGPVATGFAERAGVTRARLFRNIQGQTAETVARAGHRGFAAGRRLVIPTWANRLAVLAGQVVPGRLRNAAIAHLNRPR